MQAGKVAGAVVEPIMLATGRVVPFYTEPGASCTGEGTVVADCAKVRGEGETFANVDVGSHDCQV